MEAPQVDKQEPGRTGRVGEPACPGLAQLLRKLFQVGDALPAVDAQPAFSRLGETQIQTAAPELVPGLSVPASGCPPGAWPVRSLAMGLAAVGWMERAG